MEFEAAFERLLGHEGGYSLDPRDPGGETNFGISKRSYPGEDIAGMTVERAREIYRRDYWNASGCSALPAGIRYDVFDTAVNSGVRTAIKLLQRAAGETEDSVLGPLTLQAVQSMPIDRVRLRFSAARRLLMLSLAAWPAFSKGWMRRVAQNDLL